MVCANPSCTKANINFRCFQVFWLCLLQGFHIDCIFRVMLCRHLCHTQLASYIAGQIIVGSLPATFHSFRSHWVFEDNATQFCGNAVKIIGFTKQICHIGQVHLTTLTNRNCKSFRRGIYTRYSAFWLYGAFGEHISLSFKVSVLIYIFQRAKQVIRAIVRKSLSIGTGIDKTILLVKAVVCLIQFSLLAGNHFIGIIFQLILNQLVDNLTQPHHANDTLFCFVIEFHLTHN